MEKESPAQLRAQIRILQQQVALLTSQVDALSEANVALLASRNALRTGLQKLAVPWTVETEPELSQITGAWDTHWQSESQLPWQYAAQVLEENP